MKVKLPIGVNGHFNKPNDRDYYEFNAEKGDRLVFSAKTRSLSSACDVSLRLFDAKGTQIAESTNTTASEGLLIRAIEAPGTYRLLVEELTGAAAPDFIYHVELKRQSRGFNLSIDNDRGEKSTNGAVAVTVYCQRDRYDGPIKLSLRGLDECRVENDVIAQKKTNTTMRIFLPASFQPGQVSAVRVVGEAIIAEKPYTATASTIPALRKAFPMILYPPAQLDGLVWLSAKVAKE